MSSIKILNRNATVEAAPGQSILDAALDAGIDYPFGCHAGNCGACKTRLITGDVHIGDHSVLALNDAERRSGLILACCSTALTDCVVHYEEDSEAPRHPLRVIEAAVAGVEQATHDIVVLRLALTGAQPFTFSAGQFASLMFRGAPTRDYSMANRPDQRPLSFHVRRVPNGTVSSLIHRGDIIGQPVTIRGPYGTSFLREHHQGPVLAVAGGSGLAPITSIITTALKLGMKQQIILYFGAREARDLYLVDFFRELSRHHQNFEFIPVLSHTQSTTAARTGFLADVIGADFSDLKGWKAYLAGPPVMVETVTQTLAVRGLDRSDCHADPFYTAGDRIRPSAAG